VLGHVGWLGWGQSVPVTAHGCPKRAETGRNGWDDGAEDAEGADSPDGRRLTYTPARIAIGQELAERAGFEPASEHIARHRISKTVQALEPQGLTAGGSAGYSAPAPEAPASALAVAPDLARLTALWPSLPQAVRDRIVATAEGAALAVGTPPGSAPVPDPVRPERGARWAVRP